MLSSLVTTNPAGAKRGFASLLTRFESSPAGVPELFDMVKDVDFSVTSTDINTMNVLLYSELVDLKELLVSVSSWFPQRNHQS